MIGAARTQPQAPSTPAKAFRDGTHRLIAPEETVARVRRFMPAIGITRVADVTGLDVIGIPVVMVVRPNSRSLSVAQGKGLDLAAARASGLMESIELWHAERIALPLTLASWEEMRYTHRPIDIAALPRAGTSRFGPHLPLLWIEGHDLINGEPAWLPFEAVHTNYTLPLPSGSGCFPMTSNGLASGNHLLEALIHGICEAIERDATTLWFLRSYEEQDRRRVDLDSVNDPACCSVLEKFRRARIQVAVWETTTDLGVPAFTCLIAEQDADPLRMLYTAGGMGCHPARGIALLRALTEAAQSRLTYISGARDDLYRRHYERSRNPDVLRTHRRWATSGTPRRRFQDAPTWEGETFDDDVTWLLARLREADMGEVVMVDLTRPDLRIPVVRVVIPGLEGPEDHIPDYRHGRRGQAIIAAAGAASIGTSGAGGAA